MEFLFDLVSRRGRWSYFLVRAQNLLTKHTIAGSGSFVLSLFLAVATTAQTPRTIDEDLIHFGDLIDVDVVGGFEFDWRGTLNPEGFLDGANSFGDPIYALCRSESEVAADLTKAFSKFLRNPTVIVRLIDRSNRAVVTLDGAVRFPQRFQLRRITHLRELIVMSGGLMDDASGDIRIIRPKSLTCAPRNVDPHSSAIDGGPGGNGAQLIDITVAELIEGNETSDPIIQSGDLITVQRAVPIYIIGGVNNPRPIYARSNMRLTRAIATAGGVARDGDAGNVTVYRRSEGGSTPFEIDLNKVTADGSDDIVLRAYDIVEVGQKGKPKRKASPVLRNLTQAGPRVLPLRIVE